VLCFIVQKLEDQELNFTKYYQKLTATNDVLIVSVLVYSNCHIRQRLPQMFNVSALLLAERTQAGDANDEWRDH